MQIHFSHVSKNILDVKLSKDTKDMVFNWGLDNAHPSLIETLINGSVTSKNCVDKVAKAIYGKSFGDSGKLIVNKQGQSLNEILRLAAREYAKQNNLFIHVGYNSLFEINSIRVIPATKVRVGKADDLGYSGKFIVYNNWDKQVNKKIDTDDFQIVDRYNNNKKVIESQIEKSGGITKYKGQILHIQKDSNAIYSLSDLYPVLSEALLESNSQTFRANGSERGFLNTKLLVVKPFANDTERRNFKENLEKIQGVESKGVMVLESSAVAEDLNKEFSMEDMTSNFNDKLFEYSDSQAERNICKAFGVPQILVSKNDSGLFGNSGELLREAKKQLFEDKEEERDMLEETFYKILSNWHEPIDIKTLKIISPFQTETPTV